MSVEVYVCGMFWCHKHTQCDHIQTHESTLTRIRDIVRCVFTLWEAHQRESREYILFLPRITKSYIRIRVWVRLFCIYTLCILYTYRNVILLLLSILFPDWNTHTRIRSRTQREVEEHTHRHYVRAFPDTKIRRHSRRHRRRRRRKRREQKKRSSYFGFSDFWRVAHQHIYNRPQQCITNTYMHRSEHSENCIWCATVVVVVVVLKQ